MFCLEIETPDIPANDSDNESKLHKSSPNSNNIIKQKRSTFSKQHRAGSIAQEFSFKINKPLVVNQDKEELSEIQSETDSKSNEIVTKHIGAVPIPLSLNLKYASFYY